MSHYITPEWSRPDQIEPLSSDRIEIWRLQIQHLASSQIEVLEQSVAPEEYSHADDFCVETDRLRHLAGRGLVRLVLSQQYDRRPRRWSIVREAYGRPELAPEMADRLDIDFNIAHAGRFVLVALRRGGRVGVDLEPVTRTDGSDGVAERVLTPSEYRRWQTIDGDERASFFMHTWTAKEALIKATGEGLYRDPDTIACDYQQSTLTGLHRLEPNETELAVGSARHWELQPFEIGDRAAAALAWNETGSSPDIACLDGHEML